MCPAIDLHRFFFPSKKGERAEGKKQFRYADPIPNAFHTDGAPETILESVSFHWMTSDFFFAPAISKCRKERRVKCNEGLLYALYANLI